MDETSTLPTQGRGRPVKAVALRVIEGSAVGKTLVAEDDAPVTVGSAAGNSLVLDDKTVSRFHLQIERRGERILVADLGSTNGTAIGAVRLEGTSALVTPGAVLTLGKTQIEISDGGIRMAPPLSTRVAFGDLIGRSAVMRKLMTRVEELAASEVSVLVLGESGVGKELVARAIHEASSRRGKPLVVVDCGAITQSLFASELFGHERGAFTGADALHLGAFERAKGGTIFLDELGELAQAQQVALLGALERRLIKRVGGNADIPIDVRVVAATHRDLRAAVNAGTFRLDLYYRLAIGHINVPPLRERPEDIPLLVEHFLREAGLSEPVESFFPAATLDRLQSHPWPGNVRELRNVVSVAAALGEQPELGVAHGGTSSSPVGHLDLDYRDARAAALTDFEHRYLTRLLERSGGNFREAARVGRVDRSHLLDLLRKHGFR